MISINDGRYIGVDGCRGGWIACILNYGEFLLERFDSLEALVDHYPEFDAFLIDMVIGLEAELIRSAPMTLHERNWSPFFNDFSGTMPSGGLCRFGGRTETGKHTGAWKKSGETVDQYYSKDP